eukprot:gene33581-61159_t
MPLDDVSLCTVGKITRAVLPPAPATDCGMWERGRGHHP